MVLFSAVAVRAADVPDTQPISPHQYLLHLPGVGGELPSDHHLLRGLQLGGYHGHCEIDDWTAHDPGLDALWARDRNDAQAQKAANRILDILKNDPQAIITLTSHSAGTGIAVWALEKLPPGVQVENLLLLASALSPGYDLSKALSHVHHAAYSFYSQYDIVVLGKGTSTFGTIDGVKTEAAGKVGFVPPAGADAAEYAKLTQVPFDKNWMKLGNIGDHIGPMRTRFAQLVLAPLIVTHLPATQP